MAYLDQTQQRSPGAITAVVAVHGAIGLLLVTGLGVAIQKPDFVPNPEATHIPDVVIEPLPPEPAPDPQVMPRAAPDIFVPVPPIPMPPTGPKVDAADTPTFGDTAPIPIPTGNPGLGTLPKVEPIPSPSTPARDAVGARPRGNMAWVTQDDYRNNWIRREMTGTVAFSVTVGTGGRVEDCRITRSSGHTALDDATCKLVAKRARFDAARNTQDKKVAGNYSGSVLWQLPD